MAQRALTKEQCKQAIDAVNAALRDGYRLDSNPSAVKEAARRLKVNAGTFQHRFTAAQERYGIKPDMKLQKRLGKATEGDTVTHRLEEENKALRAAILELRKEVAALEVSRHKALGLSKMHVAPPQWKLPKSKGSDSEETPLLFTSDFQYGETIREEEVDGLNAFNVQIANERYKRLIEKTIDICYNHTAHPNYPGIYYLRGGDSISGGIHDELMDTDELKPHPAVKALAEQEIAGIRLLLQAFGKVHVISVPGNHGRVTKKPRQKGYSDFSLDDMLSWFIQMYFEAAGEKRVTFYTPRSGDAYFPVYGFNFLMTHGDRTGSRGGTGFIGPAANIAKGAFKIRQQYSRVGKYIDWVLMGHTHTPMILQHCIANGSLSGFSEYAGKELRVEPSPPSQYLFHVHPRVGINQIRELFVDDLHSERMVDGSAPWQKAA